MTETHILKIDEPYYNAVASGKKTFEIRYNDRGYQAGDNVVLYVHGTPLPKINAKIGYVTNWQQKQEYVVFSLLNVKVQKA
jgi:hypothetical protein